MMFKDATLYFSQSTLNLAMVIPIMDHINKHLATSATDDNYPLTLTAALAIGKKTQ